MKFAKEEKIFKDKIYLSCFSWSSKKKKKKIYDSVPIYYILTKWPNNIDIGIHGKCLQFITNLYTLSYFNIFCQ